MALLEKKDVVNYRVPLKHKDVPTPIGDARIKELTAHDWSLYQKQIRFSGKLEIEDSNSIFVAWCWEGSEGRLFEPFKKEDIQILANKGTSFVTPLFLAAQEVNAENKTQEELEKNS